MFGNNAKLIYSILQGEPYFSVEPKTGTPKDSFICPQKTLNVEDIGFREAKCWQFKATVIGNYLVFRLCPSGPTHFWQLGHSFSLSEQSIIPWQLYLSQQLFTDSAALTDHTGKSVIVNTPETAPTHAAACTMIYSCTTEVRLSSAHTHCWPELWGVWGGNYWRQKNV